MSERKKSVLILSTVIMVLITVFIVVVIYKQQTDLVSDNNNIISGDVDQANIDSQELAQFLTQFFTSIDTPDSHLFKELIKGTGLFSITYFGDQRDTNIVLYIGKEKIGDDEIYLRSADGRWGVDVYSIFPGKDQMDGSKIKITSSDYLSGISFPIDLHSASETEVEENLDSIVDTLAKVITVNNEYIPQVFVLKDGIYAYTMSSFITEPYWLFTGDWVIFEKTEDGYGILAVIDLE